MLIRLLFTCIPTLEKEKLAVLVWDFFFVHWMVHGLNIMGLVSPIKSNFPVVFVSTHLELEKSLKINNYQLKYLWQANIPGNSSSSIADWNWKMHSSQVAIYLPRICLGLFLPFLALVCILSLGGFCTYGTNSLADTRLTLLSPAFFALISFGIVLNLEEIFKAGSCSCSWKMKDENVVTWHN